MPTLVPAQAATKGAAGSFRFNPQRVSRAADAPRHPIDAVSNKFVLCLFYMSLSPDATDSCAELTFCVAAMPLRESSTGSISNASL
jgi:hypothetical protein